VVPPAWLASLLPEESSDEATYHDSSDNEHDENVYGNATTNEL
jgi:hypothetical protein